MEFRPKSRRVSAVAIVALLGTLHLSAQQPSQTSAASSAQPTYDIVSIRQNKSGVGGMNYQLSDDGFIATDATVEYLLEFAYDFRNDHIYGLPGWASSVNFDIKAKVTDRDRDALKKISDPQRQAMLVALLADRFHLRAHVETRSLPVYDLVIAKDGPRLKATTSVAGSNLTVGGSMGSSKWTFVAITTNGLASILNGQVGRTVIDKTGLMGKYDFTLKWTPDNVPPANTGSGDQPPNLFTALQEQFGLKLESAKGPVRTLVIDHVEMPTEN
jgi:uncharacterized protein (TIGR03435 family)